MRRKTSGSTAGGAPRIRAVVPLLARLLPVVALSASHVCPTARAANDLAYPLERQTLVRIDSVWAAGEKRVAHAALDTLIDAARAAGDRSVLPVALVLSGAQLVFFGDLHAALPRLEEGVALARETGDSTALVIGVHRLAIVAERLGREDEAQAHYGWMLEIARALKDERNEGWALIGLGWGDQQAKRYREAIDRYEEAAALLERRKDWEGYLWALNNLGTAQHSAGDYQESMETARRTATLGRERKQPLLEAMALNNLGELEYALGDPGLALQHFERSYALHAELETEWEAIVPAINIAVCQGALGRSDPAEAMLQHCLQTSVERGYLDRQGMVLTHLARLAMDRHQPHETARYFRRALALGDTLAPLSLVEARIGLAQALAELDSVAAALALLEETDAALLRTQERDLLVLVKTELGRLHLAQSRAASALAYLRPAAGMARAQGRPRELLTALVLAAKAHRLLGRPDRAHAVLTEAVGVWEANRELPLDPEWREERTALGHQLYTDLAGLILEQGRTLGIAEPRRRAFDLLQPYKARTLLERMAGPGVARTLAEAADTRGFTDLTTLQREVLSSDETFLDLYLGPETSVLFAVTTDSCRAIRLPSAAELDPILSGYRELLAAPPSDAGCDPQALTRVASRTSDLLLGGVHDLLRGRRRILIAPDGVLNLLPFAELPMPKDSPEGNAAETRAGLEEISWNRVPSATILARLRRDPLPVHAVARVRTLALAGEGDTTGVMLPGTLREVRTLGRRYRDVEARIVSASRDTLGPEILDGPDLIHIASHLAIDDQSPWQSAIRLGVATQPPKLTAARIAQLRLPARLAVLASCESAGGTVLSGEGVLGMASAFLSAGVPAVVATLWPVDDRATAEFTLRFYEGLADGRTADDALRRAQRALRDDPATRQPFYWAGFVLIGDGDVRAPLSRRSSPAPWFLAAGIVVTGALALATRRRRAGRRTTRVVPPPER